MFGPNFAKLAEHPRLTHKQHMTLSDHQAICGCIERRDSVAAYALMLVYRVNVELALTQGNNGVHHHGTVNMRLVGADIGARQMGIVLGDITGTGLRESDGARRSEIRTGDAEGES